MTGFESTLAAALRAEAREAAMSTETPQQYEILSSRLDEVDLDRRRSRRRVVGAVAAAAAVVAVGALVVQPGGLFSAPSPGSAPPAASSAPDDPFPVKGHWSTLLTEAEAVGSLSGTSVSSELGWVLDDLAGFAGTTAAVGPWRLDLWLDAQSGTLYIEDSAGEPVLIDRFTGVLYGDELETVSSSEPGSTDTARYRVVVDGPRMSLEWLSGSATGRDSVGEAPKRILYTASEWERVGS